MLFYEAYTTVMFVCGDKKYMSYSKWCIKKRKKERKGNHCLGGLCHPSFMVLERAALSAHREHNKQTEGKGKMEGGVFRPAGK